MQHSSNQFNKHWCQLWSQNCMCPPKTRSFQSRSRS